MAERRSRCQILKLRLQSCKAAGLSEKGEIEMNILGMILLGIGGIFGIALVGGTVVSMIGVILYKIYRKIRYNISLYN